MAPPRYLPTHALCVDEVERIKSNLVALFSPYGSCLGCRPGRGRQPSSPCSHRSSWVRNYMSASARFADSGQILRQVREGPIAEVGSTRSPRQHGREARRPSRSITTETLTKTVDQLDQHYKCYVCNLGIHPDTRRMVFASRTGSRDIVHDSYLCIAV